jgi:Tfp pilus assembly protein PilO
MVLSKRERIVALMAILVVGAFALDSFVLSPTLRRLQTTENQKQELLAQLNEAQSLFERRGLLEKKWKTMLSDGLGSDAEAESRVARALDEWSVDTRLTLSSVKPERGASDKGLKEMTFVVAGKGRLDAVARFLYKVETVEMPLKIKDMQLGSASEAGDSMSLQLRLSALYLGTNEKPAREQSQPRQQEANDEDQLLQ